MKRYFLVGYFKRNEHKLEFAKILPQENLYFLEASTFVKPNSSENLFHAPQRLYSLLLSKRWRHTHKKIPINSFTRELYRRDVKAYYSNLIAPDRPISKFPLYTVALFGVYCLRHYQRSYRLRSNDGLLKRIPLATFDFIKKFNIKSAFGKSDVKLIRSFLLKYSFVAGYNYYLDLFRELKPTKDDVFLIWGQHYSGNLMVEELLSKTDAVQKILEFGEVSGTVTINNDGIFGESDIAKNYQQFNKLNISERDKEATKTYLDKLEIQEMCSRNETNGFYDLCLNSFQLNENRKKVVYVNGSELIAAGHTLNSSLMGKKYHNPNKELLKKVCDSLDLNEYMVLYKDHPMTVRQSKKLLINSDEFPRVVFCDDMNMTTLLGIADLVVTFPSKVLMSALMNKNKAILVGEFTIKAPNTDIGLYDAESLNSLERVVDSKISNDYSVMVDAITRMLKYKLIKYDVSLFQDLDIDVEREKFLSIL